MLDQTPRSWRVGLTLSALLLSACETTGDDDGFGTPTPTPGELGQSPGAEPTATPTPSPDPFLYVQDAAAILSGSAASDRLGFAVVVAGDLNGDGFDDLAFSAPYRDERQPDGGSVGILFGAPSGFESQSLAELEVTLGGEGREDLAGHTLAAGGDLNGDGLDELLVGAPFNDLGGPDAGRVYVVFGRSSGWYPGMRLSDQPSFFGVAGEAIGAIDTVAGGADLNGDGLDDLAIGSPFAAPTGTDSGQVTLILGKSTGWEQHAPLSEAGLVLKGEAAHDRAGFSVALSPDLGQDGYADLLVGAPLSARGGRGGAVYLLPGRAGLTGSAQSLSVCEHIFVSTQEGLELGSHVAPGRDLNADGLNDFVVGAWGNGTTQGQGLYYLVAGSSAFKPGQKVEYSIQSMALSRITGSYAGEGVGQAGLGIADLNGDGIDDLLLGSWRGNLAALIPGQTSWPETLSFGAAPLLLIAQLPGDGLGFAVAGGDLDGDDVPELIVGALNADSGLLVDAGKLYVMRGARSWPYQSVNPP